MCRAWISGVRDRRPEVLALTLGVGAVPASIAVAESLLGIGLIAFIAGAVRSEERRRLPRVFWFWSVLALLEISSCAISPDPLAGTGEMRHLFVVASIFTLITAMERDQDAVATWQVVFVTATLSSLVLVVVFVVRSLTHAGVARAVALGVYVRNGGLLHNWMVFGSVEIIVFAALLEYWQFYPEHRLRLLPAMILNCVAIILSLTRMLWLCCLVLLVFHFMWHRSRAIWALPALVALMTIAAPAVVRERLKESLQSDYYSNTERLQMLRVGWAMITRNPLTGVGPGRAGKLYSDFLAPGEAVPAYHGHLHNNVVQIAAEFGLPVAAAATLCLAVLIYDLLRAYRSTTDRGSRFLASTALLGMVGFVLAGMFDYTFGHSLALILMTFAAITPLRVVARRPTPSNIQSGRTPFT